MRSKRGKFLATPQLELGRGLGLVVRVQFFLPVLASLDSLNFQHSAVLRSVL